MFNCDQDQPHEPVSTSLDTRLPLRKYSHTLRAISSPALAVWMGFMLHSPCWWIGAWFLGQVVIHTDLGSQPRRKSTGRRRCPMDSRIHERQRPAQVLQPRMASPVLCQHKGYLRHAHSLHFSNPTWRRTCFAA